MPIDTIGFSDERLMLAESVARFVDDHCTLTRQRQWWAGQGIPGAWREIADRGWVGVAIAEENGGLGGSSLDEVVIASGVGNGLLPIAYTPIAVMAVALLQASDSANDALAAMAAGSLRLTVAHAEDGMTLDGSPATTIVAHDYAYRISGRKALVLGVDEADAMLVTARNAADGSLAIARVDCGAAGIDRSDVTLLDGRQASNILLDLRIDRSSILLCGAAAVHGLAFAQDRAALASAAEAVGAMHGALELTRAHLATRRQFGRTLMEFQALQHTFATMVAELEMAESTVIAAAAVSDDPDAFRKMVSVAKTRTATAGRMVAESAIQIHGGIGMTDEYAVGQFYKRLLVLQTLYGSREEHLDRIATMTQTESSVS